jgi:DNA-binding transcriptional MocR family regulator
VVNGGGAAMEVLACCLLDPGDVLLTPSPCYTRIFVNFSERFEVSVVDVLLRDTNEVSSRFYRHQYSGWNTTISGGLSRKYYDYVFTMRVL